MKALQSIAVVFSLMMISQAAGQESTDKQKAFAGHWALEMSNGAAGWLALELKRRGMERTALDGGGTQNDQKPPVCRWKAYLPTGPENRSARVSRRTLYRRPGNA